MLTASTSEFLTPAELRDLTGCARRGDQARVLAEQGLPFRQLGERIVVSRYHARQWLAGESVTPSKKPKLELVR
ncbi:MAG TPA: DUF4224 domain-containing protein [Methylibium sp.]|nr:DUF4224 domain-containing protein [Methylibium sp.]